MGRLARAAVWLRAEVGLDREGASFYVREMIARIRHLLRQSPFVAFTIHTSDGRNLRVPTLDHLAISGNFSVVVTNDNGEVDILPALHISGLTVDSVGATSEV